MKKFIILLSVFLFVSCNMNIITATAQPKIYSQGFYILKDLNLYENNTYTVQNVEPYADGLIFIIDSDQKIQQFLRIPPNSIKYTLIPLKNDYRFIVSGNIRLVFS